MQIIARKGLSAGAKHTQASASRGLTVRNACASIKAPCVTACHLQGKKVHCATRSAPSKTRRMATVTNATAAEAELTLDKTELSATLRRLTITVPASMCQEGFHATVKNLKDIVGNLPGFRKDKIPLSMLVTQCGGQRQFKLTIIEEILMKVMPLALSKTGDPLVPESERIASNINDMEPSFDPAKPFIFDIEYETVPPIKWIRPYKEAQVTIKDTGNFTTDSAAVDDLIRQYLKEKGFQRVVVGRGLQKGDTCIMDIQVCTAGSKTPLPGMKKSKVPLDTEMDPLGLGKGMEGMKAGEERAFKIQFPKDYSVELWRGMEADVTAKVHELFNWHLPEFNDEFVKARYGDKFDSAEDMRKQLLASTAMERMKDLDRQLEDTILDAVVACMDVPEVPEKLVLDMGSTQYRNNLLQMLQNKTATKEDVEKLLTEELVEEYIAKNKKDLEDIVKFNLAVDHIYDAEGLTIDEADIKSEMDDQKKQYEAQQLEYDPQVLRDQVLDSFKSVRVIEWLKDNIQRTVLPFEAA